MVNRALILIMAVAVGGCDFVDYYPQHESPERTSDIQKDGSGSYGGSNSNFPIGTPGTTPGTGPKPAGNTTAPGQLPST